MLAVILTQGALEDMELCIPLMPPKYQWDIKKEAKDLREEMKAAAHKAAVDAAVAQEASTAVLGKGGHVVLQEIGPDHEEEMEVGMGHYVRKSVKREKSGFRVRREGTGREGGMKERRWERGEGRVGGGGAKERGRG